MCNVSEIVKSVGIKLPHGEVIKSLQEGESYKYTQILEADRFFRRGGEAESF